MNLFNISIKNVKNSFSNYVMYFVSIIFSVFIFFSFKSIQYNDALSILGEKTRSGINSASMVIAIFVFLFIYYSNAFFLNRRKQEIGTYSILGMRKKQIGKIFLYETILMGLGAIFIGVLLGILFSKFITMMLVKLMGEAIIVKMDLSLNALAQTIVVFAVIFIIIAIRNIIVIKNKRLIDLFKKESEYRGKKKYLKLKGVIGILLIVLSYAIASSDFILLNIMMAPLILLIIVPGTFLFFSSAISLILDSIKKNKEFYYRGRNLIAFSELSYKIQSNSRILATIAILIATSITVLGFTVSLYYDIDKQISEYYKYSYTINADDENLNKKVDSILQKYSKSNKVVFDKTIDIIQDEVSYDTTTKNSNLKEEHTEHVDIIKESDFKALKDYKNSEYKKLDSDTDVYLILDQYNNMFNTVLDNSELRMNNKIFNIKTTSIEAELNDRSTLNSLIVKDEVFDKLYKEREPRKLRVLDVHNDKEALEMSREIENTVDSSIGFNYPFNITSKAITYRDLIETNGLLLFIGVFLSVVFLLCTGSIILFKQLSNIYDDKDRYIMLKKIGANKKDIEKILSKQLKLIFLLPLAIGTIHNLFAMVILQKIMSRSIVVPVLITLAIYYTGYFIYYFITLKYAKD